MSVRGAFVVYPDRQTIATCIEGKSPKYLVASASNDGGGAHEQRVVGLRVRVAYRHESKVVWSFALGQGGCSMAHKARWSSVTQRVHAVRVRLWVAGSVQPFRFEPFGLKRFGLSSAESRESLYQELGEF